MITRPKTLPLLLLSVLFAMTSYICSAQGTEDQVRNISIRPSTLSFDLAAGQSASKQVSVTNGTDRKIQFKVYMTDWLRDSIGGHAYYRADTLDISCARWVQFDKSFLEVEPGQTETFNVKVQVPDEPDAAEKMKWAMVFVQTIEEKMTPDKKDGLTSVVNNKMRVGVHVYQTPPNLSKKEVQILRLSAMPDTVNQYKMICKNTGEIQMNCKTYMELSSLTTSEKFRVEGRVFPIFPAQERMVTFTVPSDIPAGKYNAVAAVDAGDDVPLEVAQAIISVK